MAVDAFGAHDLARAPIDLEPIKRPVWPTSAYERGLSVDLEVAEVRPAVPNKLAMELMMRETVHGRQVGLLRMIGLEVRLLAPASPIRPVVDRKSTRLNSSHVKISYAVFCLK